MVRVNTLLRRAELHQEFKLAILPIGAFRPIWFMKPSHMGPTEAVKAIALLNAENTLAVHIETFALGDENYHEPRELFRQSVQQAKLTYSATQSPHSRREVGSLVDRNSYILSPS